MLKPCFKPCYKWITFNTQKKKHYIEIVRVVLNLVINGLPSIRMKDEANELEEDLVLNLVINGLPSIPNINEVKQISLSF